MGGGSGAADSGGGSGASGASVVATGGRAVAVHMPGGVLAIELRESDGHVLMTGPAALAYRGEIDLGAPAG